MWARTITALHKNFQLVTIVIEIPPKRKLTNCIRMDFSNKEVKLFWQFFGFVQ